MEGDMCRKLLFVTIMVVFIFVVSGCGKVNRGSVSEANLLQDGEVIFKYTQDEHSDEMKVLIKMVNKVRKQHGMVDMPPSDYQLEFVLEDGENISYSLWSDPDSSTILENSSSEYVELSHSDTGKLNQVVTEFDASGTNHFNFYYFAMAIPLLIVIPMLMDMVVRKRGDF
jgi:hypothetical protein